MRRLSGVYLMGHSLATNPDVEREQNGNNDEPPHPALAGRGRRESENSLTSSEPSCRVRRVREQHHG